MALKHSEFFSDFDKQQLFRRLGNADQFDKFIADYDPRKLQALRDLLEEHLISLSRQTDEIPLTPKDVKYLQDPVFKYYEKKNCGEPLTACIMETCAEKHPFCFSDKMKLQIRRLQELIMPYLRSSGEIPAEAPPKRRRVLVVDDDVYQIKLLKYKLVKDDYVVDGAENGLEALELLQKNDYDIIVCDLMMPGMDGFTFLQKIKEDENLKNIPLIFLTAMHDEQNIVKGLKLGADDYLTKPFSPSELSMRLEKILRKKP